MLMVKQTPYMKDIKHKAKLSHSVAEVTTVHYFMWLHLNILSTCGCFLCLLLITLNWDHLLQSQFLLSMWLSELSINQKITQSDF